MMGKLWPLLALVLAMAAGGCLSPATTTTPPVIYSVYELEYRLLDDYSDYFWGDPYLWPIVRSEQEAMDAREQFPEIRASAAEFTAILGHLDLPEKTDYSDAEKLLIFREHNKLGGAVQIADSGDVYEFTLRVGEGEGKRIEGTITPAGEVDVRSEETSINTCPICLAGGTLIATPGGPVPVERLRPGMEVWTVDAAGRPVVAALLAVSATPVPPSFRVVRLTLADGRSVTASPGHPTAMGRSLGSYQPGEYLDGALVATVETVDYSGGKTYDLLPAGVTGYYRAGGILLGSTIVLSDK
jgi:hypothetical protein